MNDQELLEKYRALAAENEILKKENAQLKAKLCDLCPSQDPASIISPPAALEEQTDVKVLKTAAGPELPPQEKINLFKALFAGRDDVYARRWENKKGEKGYVPACLTEWKEGFCRKPRVKCADCPHKLYEKLTDQVIEDHLRGNAVIGVYPLLADETCRFLAIDFDKEEWQKDVSAFRSVCQSFNLPFALERSRSGNGAHVWFFFEHPIAAILARRFGSALITQAMSTDHQISFKSYDRLFPNQDTLPKGGLGNLIALPLQKKARELGNSVFLDEHFEPYPNQWDYLSSIPKISEETVLSFSTRLGGPDELGDLRHDEEEDEKPWKPKRQTRLTLQDFPSKMTFVRANMIFISKAGISQQGLNALKRLAAFKNPEFYKAQAMRLSTYKKSRIVSCCDETDHYLCLPRGCEADVKTLLADAGVPADVLDNTQNGKSIHVDFKGALREDQNLAVAELLKHDTGVLSATTAFGKTVIAAKIIAERKVNTLILVHRQQLLDQWNDRLKTFLNISETLPALEKKRGRKKAQSIIGWIGGGKSNPSGIVDIAIMQSLNRSGDVRALVKDYGMVIVDECHHVPAFSFEEILKAVSAKYVYGLTATPARKDGHHPIIFMHCGPVRYRVDARAQAELRPFEHYVIPRFTNFRSADEKNGKAATIQELYSEIAQDDWRNRFLIDDVVGSHTRGRNCLVLTERTAHVEALGKMLQGHIPDVISLTGNASAKNKKASFMKIKQIPPEQPLTLLATGKYIGEGFDEPRLDTLFLAMPISWKGTIQQYAGRLHRLFDSKENVQIYDYVDSQVRVFAKMYHKRLAGYASLGYKVKGENIAEHSVNLIFDQHNFRPVYENDLAAADKEILIVSPFVTKRRLQHAIPLFRTALQKQINVTLLTRPAEDHKEGAVLPALFAEMKSLGVSLVFQSGIHQKFAIFDRRIVWYGSINLLGYGHSEETLMRLESAAIAGELLRSLE